MKSPTNKKMKKSGANSTDANSFNLPGAMMFSDETENARLKSLLRKAVKKDAAAPESLREGIRRMIRQ